MSSTSSTPSIPADVQHFPAIPSYVVALSVVAAVVVTALVIFILYSCLVQMSKKRQGTIVERSPIRETERLREETAVELDVSLTDSAAVVTGHEKPKPSPSIFSRGDFLMEVLEGVENTTDLSIDGDVENTNHVCEDRITVAMDDLELDKDDNHSASQFLSTPPRQSATMDLFLENLSTPTVPPSCCTLGLRVREDYQADASTAALRGSISSGEGGRGSEGREVIVCGDIEIYEDPVVGDYEDPTLGEIYEDPVVGEIYEDPVVSEIYEDPVASEIFNDPEVYSVKEVKVGIECHDDETDYLANDNIKKKNSNNENKSTAAPVEDIPSLNLSIGFHEHALIIPEVDFEDDQVEEVANFPASNSAIREEESFSLEVGGIELAQDIKEDEGYTNLSPPIEIPSSPLTMHGNTSPRISGQDPSCSNTPLQASTCLAELEVTPASTIPFNIIPVSNKKDPNPNTLSAQLSQSTPTSLLHPLVSLHALPLTDRALSVSHLSLNRSGKHLPATPLSCNSEYSPVYNMQFGSARRLPDETATEVVAMDRGEIEGKEYEEEVDILTSGDASEVNQELKMQ